MYNSISTRIFIHFEMYVCMYKQFAVKANKGSIMTTVIELFTNGLEG